MNIEQLESNLTSNENATEAIAATAVAVEVPQETPAKRVYTKKEDMQRGNDAILATLPTVEAEGLSKAQILAALSAEDRTLVEHNWNLRISLLETTEQVLSKGKKVAKKYYRAA